MNKSGEFDELQESIWSSSEELDIGIINQLQQNPRASYSTIARLLGASDTTVRRRMNTLFRQNRLRMSVLPNPSLIGFPYSGLLLIRTAPGKAEHVGQAIAALWQSTYVSEVLGTSSVSCIVRERTQVALMELIHTTIANIDGVTSIETHLVPKVFKGWGQWRLPNPQGADSEGEPNEHGLAMP